MSQNVSAKEASPKSPRLDSSAASPCRAKTHFTAKPQTPRTAAGVGSPPPVRAANPATPQDLGFKHSNGRNSVTPTHRSEEQMGQSQPSTPGSGCASGGRGVGFPKAGALVVPLVEVEGKWAIDWDALRFGAAPPELAAGLPEEAFKVGGVLHGPRVWKHETSC